MNEGGASVPEVSAQPVPGENEEAPKPKRRRTTRRKKDAEDASAAADVSAESAEKAEKPVRRRRTRKKAAEAENAEAPAAETPKAEAAAEEAPKPQRRRRTRKQTSDEAASAEPAPSETAPQEPAVHAEHESAEVPAEHEQRREHEGRAEHAEEAAPAAEKQEHEAEPAAESSSEQQEGSASEHEHEHEERGRGRRRQNRRFERNGSEHQGGQNGERQEHGRFNQRNDRFNQRNNRQNGQNRRRNNRRQEVPEPSLTRDELKEMKVAELRSKAAELGVEYVGLRKVDLVESIFEAAAKAEGFRPVTGILEIQPEGYGFIRTGNYMQGDDDAFVFQQMIKQNGLRTGDEVSGTVGPNRNNSKFPPLISIDTVDGMTVEELRRRPRFRDLTPIYPNE